MSIKRSVVSPLGFSHSHRVDELVNGLSVSAVSVGLYDVESLRVGDSGSVLFDSGVEVRLVGGKGKFGGILDAQDVITGLTSEWAELSLMA